MVLPFFGKTLEWFNLPKNAIAVSLDLRDAFYQIGLSNSAKRYTTFKFDSHFYQFNRLPMGLSSSPAILQNTLMVVLDLFQPAPLKICFHIDDVLIIAKSSWFSRHLNQFLSFLGDCNVSINFNKSQLQPSATIHYCGAILDLVHRTIRPTAAKISKTVLLSTINVTNHRPYIRKKIMGFITYVLPLIGLPYSVGQFTPYEIFHIIMAALKSDLAFRIGKIFSPTTVLLNKPPQ